MGLFGWWSRRPEGGGEDPAPPEPRLGPSGPLARILAAAGEVVEAGGRQPRALLVGPPSGRTIETLAGAGFRVTVDGEPEPRPPLEYGDGEFDLVLAFDLPDGLADEDLAPLLAEWSRVLRRGGTLWFLAACGGEEAVPLRRWDLWPDGSLSSREVLRRVDRTCRRRSNRDLERLARPLGGAEITLRRDGLREIVCRRRT